jgi:hypothetical protein
MCLYFLRNGILITPEANCNKVYKMSHMSLVLFHRINVLRLTPLIWTVHCVSFPLVPSSAVCSKSQNSIYFWIRQLLLEEFTLVGGGRRVHKYVAAVIPLWICCILNESTCVITHSVELNSNFFYCSISTLSNCRHIDMNYPGTCWYIVHVQTRCVSRLISNFLKAATK